MSKMPEIRFITAYGPKRRVTLTCGPSMTKQSFKEECDINNIIANFTKTGLLEYAQEHQPQYGDVTGIDFQTAMQTISQANEMFDELPSKIRQRFQNDPVAFLDFIQDPESRSEAIQLGLIDPQRVEDAEAAKGPRTRRKADSVKPVPPGGGSSEPGAKAPSGGEAK